VAFCIEAAAELAPETAQLRMRQACRRGPLELRRRCAHRPWLLLVLVLLMVLLLLLSGRRRRRLVERLQ
jgi:hypothetical protein